MRSFILSLLFLLAASVAGAQGFGAGADSRTETLIQQMISSRINGAYGASTCMAVREQHDADGGIACNSAQYGHVMAYDFTITEIAWGVRESVGLDTFSGCKTRLTADNGTSDLGSSEINIPTSNVTLTDGTSGSMAVNIELDAGDYFAVQQANGDFCGNGASCVCVGDEFAYFYVLRGYRR